MCWVDCGSNDCKYCSGLISWCDVSLCLNNTACKQLLTMNLYICCLEKFVLAQVGCLLEFVSTVVLLFDKAAAVEYRKNGMFVVWKPCKYSVLCNDIEMIWRLLNWKWMAGRTVTKSYDPELRPVCVNILI